MFNIFLALKYVLWGEILVNNPCVIHPSSVLQPQFRIAFPKLNHGIAQSQIPRTAGDQPHILQSAIRKNASHLMGVTSGDSLSRLDLKLASLKWAVVAADQRSAGGPWESRSARSLRQRSTVTLSVYFAPTTDRMPPVSADRFWCRSPFQRFRRVTTHRRARSADKLFTTSWLGPRQTISHTILFYTVQLYNCRMRAAAYRRTHCAKNQMVKYPDSALQRT